ncbi:hypothetical protein M758_4G051700 [Ceratodon purpureus]|nr:hypothetical protein M758_4G051700 [Ceratodon purpureus]
MTKEVSSGTYQIHTYAYNFNSNSTTSSNPAAPPKLQSFTSTQFRHNLPIHKRSLYTPQPCLPSKIQKPIHQAPNKSRKQATQPSESSAGHHHNKINTLLRQTIQTSPTPTHHRHSKLPNFQPSTSKPTPRPQSTPQTPHTITTPWCPLSTGLAQIGLQPSPRGTTPQHHTLECNKISKLPQYKLSNNRT